MLAALPARELAARAATWRDNSHRSQTAGHRSHHLSHQRQAGGRHLGIAAGWRCDGGIGQHRRSDAHRHDVWTAAPKALDKFAIAEQLDNVGAEISFAVGYQSLEIRAKCLKKDLPLVLGLLARN